MGYSSKKLISIVASSTAVLVFVLWLAFPHTHIRSNSLSFEAQKTNSSQTHVYNDDPNKDTDDDGLKDWEEVLWNTNPYTVDTDNDGVSDATEIEERKKAGSGPRISQNTGGSVRNIIAQTFPYGSTRLNTDVNISKAVTEKFMETYLKEKYQEQAAGVSVNQEQLSASLLNDFKDKLETERFQQQGVFVTKQDIKIGTETSPEHMRSYFNELGMILLTTDSPDTPEFEIIKEIINQTDGNFEFNSARIKKLHDYSLMYLSYATRMRDMRVPQNIVSAHVDMTNSFIRLSMIVEDIMHVEFDPLKGFAAVGAYVDEIKRSEQPLRVFVEEIKKNNLTFAETEGGMVFANFTAKL